MTRNGKEILNSQKMALSLW